MQWSPSTTEGWTVEEAFEAWENGQFSQDSLSSSLFQDKHTEIWFRLPSTLKVRGRWLVHSEQPGLDEFVLYHRSPDGDWQSQAVGDSVAWEERPLGYGRHTLPVPLGQDILFLKVKSESRVDTELNILQSEELLLDMRTRNLSQAFTGTWILFIALAFLFARTILKMKYLLWLSFASFCYALALLVFQGIAAEFLWPGYGGSTTRLVYLLGMMAMGSHVSFVYARVLKRGQQGAGSWVGGETIGLGICLALVIVLPLEWAGSIWVFATAASQLSMVLLMKKYEVDRGESWIINTSHWVMLIATFMLVAELEGLLRVGPKAYSALWGLVGLVPTIWFLGVGRYYQKLEVEHAQARRTSKGFENQLHEAFESRLQIFSSIAHHLNNPLNYILLGVAKARDELGYIQRKVHTLFEHAEKTSEAQSILRQFEDAFERCESVFDDASFGVQRAAHVVDEMRGLTSIDGESSELIPLKDILSSMKRRVVDDLGKKIIEPVSLRENLGQIEDFGVYGNPYLIIHAMKNIVNNGYLFARRSSRPQPELVIDVDTECEPGLVRILVSNNGPAIGPEHEDNIFKMGFSSYGRRGTGLNVTQSILRESGGKVLLEDNGRDSGWVRFSVLLPLLSDVERSPTSSL